MARFTKVLLATLLLFVINFESLFGQGESFTVTNIGSNNLLKRPLVLKYGPDKHLWITERVVGVVTRVNPVDGKRDDLIKIPDIYSTGGQDGLIGMLLYGDINGKPEHVYLSYTYFINNQRRQKIVRYNYQNMDGDGSLVTPVILIQGLPASNDHNSAKFALGPDGKIYYTIGDQGNNQNANFCKPIVSQNLPSQEEIDQKNYTYYPGKILRMNLDGSIPSDNPVLGGVKSHIYSFGHRNAQGIAFSSNGTLYSSEHGPDTDDEINIISKGMNYGWPFVVGYNDSEAYDYCNWSALSNCSSLTFSKVCPQNSILKEEKSFTAPNLKEPLLAMYAVKDDYNYKDPKCQNEWICRPNIAPSGLIVYESDAIPGWKNSLLIPSLKRGQIYRLKLDATGQKIISDSIQYFYTQNRYRDIAMDPDGKSFYLITDEAGNLAGPSGLTQVSPLRNPASILKFTYNATVNVDDVPLSDKIKVYPNPASSSIYLQTLDLKEDVEVSIYNTTGKLIKQFGKSNNDLIEINVADISEGMYVVKLNTEGQSAFKKIAIVR